MSKTPEKIGDGTPEWKGDATPDWNGDGTPELGQNGTPEMSLQIGSFALIKERKVVVKILDSDHDFGGEPTYNCAHAFPQFREEVLCKFFINGKCAKNDCTYSHGFQMKHSELDPYTLPTELHIGEDVLAKDEGLWYRAVLKRTTDTSRTIEFKRKEGINITLKPKNVTRYLGFKRKRDPAIEQPRKKVKMPEIVNTPGEFGKWHSGGFGLKSLMKYGYKPGTGLGKDQEGRVEPIPVKKLKKNVGLDYASAKIVPKKIRRKAVPLIPPEDPKTFDFLNRHEKKVKRSEMKKPKKRTIRLEDKSTLRKANETTIALQKNQDRFQKRIIALRSSKDFDLAKRYEEKLESTKKKLKKLSKINSVATSVQRDRRDYNKQTFKF